MLNCEMIFLILNKNFIKQNKIKSCKNECLKLN